MFLYILHETSLIQMFCPATAIRAILAQTFVLSEPYNVMKPASVLAVATVIEVGEKDGSDGSDVGEEVG